MKLLELFKIIKPLLQFAGPNINDAAQRAVTIPKAQRTALYSGLNEEEIAKAEELYTIHADATADFLVYVASRGAVDPD
jgi:hypothetical protein